MQCLCRTVFYGKPISVKDMFNPKDERGSVETIKKVVSDKLKTLTTHIENEVTYEETIQKLNTIGVDYLKPSEVNTTLKNLDALHEIQGKDKTNFLRAIFTGLFTLLNFLPLLIWRLFAKPKVWEPEFMGTLRFAFSLLIYPIYYGLVFAIVTTISTPILGLGVALGLFVFNWFYTRLE